MRFLAMPEPAMMELSVKGRHPAMEEVPAGLPQPKALVAPAPTLALMAMELGRAGPVLDAAPAGRVVEAAYRLPCPHPGPPVLASRLRAVLGDNGYPQAWWQRMMFHPGCCDAFRLPYGIAHQSIRALEGPAPVAPGGRGAANLGLHGFISECFIDELAQAAWRDPLQYRRELLPAGSRARRVLDEAAWRSSWSRALPEGRARGVALTEWHGAAVAQVAELSLQVDGWPRVHRFTTVVDGEVPAHSHTIHTARLQVAAGVLASLGRLVVMAEVPQPDVHLVPGGSPWDGRDGPADLLVPGVAAAVANALSVLRGERVRELPLVPGPSGGGDPPMR
jgi:isoquinoline 1-oxidoreductase subunit beta